MVDKIDIPIEVSGSKEAQGEIKRTADAVAQASKAGAESTREAGKAGAETAAKQQQLNKELKDGGELFGDIDKNSERMAKTLLAQVNPEFAQMVELILNVGKGAQNASIALAGVVSGALLIGLGTLAWREYSRAAAEAEAAVRRVEDAERSRRLAANQETADIGRKAVALGIRTPGDLLARRAAQIAESGIPADIAESAVLAEQLGGLSPEQTEQLLAGLAIGGAEPLKFDRSRPGQNQHLIRQAIRAGGRPGAAELLASLRASRLPPTIPDALDQVMRGLAEQFPALDEEALRQVRRLLQAQVTQGAGPQDIDPAFANLRLVRERQARRFGVPTDFFRLAVQEVEESFRSRAAAFAGGEAGPRVINIHNNNIGQAFLREGLLDTVTPRDVFEFDARE